MMLKKHNLYLNSKILYLFFTILRIKKGKRPSTEKKAEES